MNLTQARTLLQIGGVFLTLAACSPRVIERIKTVEIVRPVAAPCPLPADVVPRPAKPSAPLPDDAVRALAIVTGQLVLERAWGDVTERQVAACSQVSSNP